MDKFSLKVTFLLTILITISLGMSVLYYFSYENLQTKVEKYQDNLYNQKIDNIIFLIEQKYKTLQKTQMPGAYKKSFKRGTIKIIKEIFTKNTKEIFPFIINGHNEFILDPKLNLSNKKLYFNNQVFSSISKLKDGNFAILEKGKKKWIIFKYYPEWNWTIGYSVTNEHKYKELFEFRKDFLTITFSILCIIAIFIIILINYFVTPITKLTEITKKISAGNLDISINIRGSLELKELSKNFALMRDHLINDISKLQTIENEIKDLNMSLEQKVESRTLELEESNYTLQDTISNLKVAQHKLIESEKMACIGSLVAGVAHEINTPVGVGLTGITHLLDLTDELFKKYSSNSISEDEFEEYLTASKDLGNQIHFNLERTASLIRSFKQVAVDQTNGGKRVFQIKEYLEEVIFSLHSIIKKTNIIIKVNSIESLTIDSYPGAYSQIISNLIINSIRHAYEKDEKGIITIDISNKQDMIKITYKDNGRGIQKEHLPKIFNPFFTTNRTKGGTGLGLNIISNIISSQLKGSISCRSEIGEGVEFLITLPLEV